MDQMIRKFLNKNGLLIIILVLAIFIRFYNFTDRINFGPEQAISLLVSSDYINEKFSFLGLPSTQRTTSFGHIIFYPPIFNYSLIPLLILFNYQPVGITAYFAVLNILTGLLIYFAVNKILNKPSALFAATLFLFNDYMINHSLFIWSVNYLPILNLGVIFILARIYLRKSQNFEKFLLGLLVGLSFGVEYIYLFTGILVFFLMIFYARNKLKAVFLFISGGIISLLPTIIFDLSHNFYHLKTLWQYSLDTLSNPGQSHITYYHFLHFWPLLSILAGCCLYIIYKQSKLASFLLLFTILLMNLISSNISFVKPVGMVNGLNYSILDKASSLISKDNPQNFNVVTTFDFNSRAHPLRYLLKYKYQNTPNGVEDYPLSDTLYVLAPSGYQTTTTSLWEISSFQPEQSTILESFGDFSLYKLTKQN